jgi:hypothetical protein
MGNNKPPLPALSEPWADPAYDAVDVRSHYTALQSYFEGDVSFSACARVGLGFSSNEVKHIRAWNQIYSSTDLNLSG